MEDRNAAEGLEALNSRSLSQVADEGPSDDAQVDAMMAFIEWFPQPAKLMQPSEEERGGNHRRSTATDDGGAF